MLRKDGLLNNEMKGGVDELVLDAGCLYKKLYCGNQFFGLVSSMLFLISKFGKCPLDILPGCQFVSERMEIRKTQR